MANGLASKYGMHGLTLAQHSEAGSGVSNGAITADAKRLLDPDNPLLWLLGIGAVTLGLVGLSTSARVGPLRASASAGTT